MTETLAKETPADIDAGLKLASSLSNVGGWMNFNMTQTDNDPLKLKIDAGVRLTPEWVAYGNAWAAPTEGKFGGEAGMRFMDHLDFFVEGTGDTHGSHDIMAGIGFKF